jgi:hypothetical protein
MLQLSQLQNRFLKKGVSMENNTDFSSSKPTILSNSIHKALHGRPEDLKEMHGMLRTLSYLLETLHLADVKKVFLKHRIESLVGILDAGGEVEYFQQIQEVLREHLES